MIALPRCTSFAALHESGYDAVDGSSTGQSASQNGYFRCAALMLPFKW
jgi:hypothetical protein